MRSLVKDLSPSVEIQRLDSWKYKFGPCLIFVSNFMHTIDSSKLDIRRLRVFHSLALRFSVSILIADTSICSSLLLPLAVLRSVFLGDKVLRFARMEHELDDGRPFGALCAVFFLVKHHWQSVYLFYILVIFLFTFFFQGKIQTSP